jgi:hypothetical protein
VVPHPIDPLVRVWAEGRSREDAGRLASDVAGLIDELRDERR